MVQILGFQIINASCSVVQPNESTAVYVPFTPVSGATYYFPLISFMGWLNISATSIEGNNVRVEFLNIGQVAHSGAAKLGLLAYKVI